MLQLNDADHTLIDLSKKNLRHIKLNNHYWIKILYASGEDEVETMFKYDTVDAARDDYQMLIGMVDEDKYRAATSFGIDPEQYGFQNLSNSMDEARKRWKEEKT
tara:strand:+ start:352 stop:663 length:312 start_codon:yes stop_codon:yes gene_type:complete